MFSISLKRSAATLGVVAGLLAAAAPASAMPINMKVDDGAVVSRPDQTAQTLQHEGANDTNALNDHGFTEGNGTPCRCDGPFSAKPVSGYSFGASQTGSFRTAAAPVAMDASSKEAAY